MPDRLTPEQIAAGIVSTFDDVTSACPDPPSCFLCANCEAHLEQAIAAALAEQEIHALNESTQQVDDERRRWYAALEAVIGGDLEGFAPEIAVLAVTRKLAEQDAEIARLTQERDEADEAWKAAEDALLGRSEARGRGRL